MDAFGSAYDMLQQSDAKHQVTILFWTPSLSGPIDLQIMMGGW
jgi:hypothetical protein